MFEINQITTILFGANETFELLVRFGLDLWSGYLTKPILEFCINVRNCTISENANVMYEANYDAKNLINFTFYLLISVVIRNKFNT